MQVSNSQLKKYLLGSLDAASSEEIGLQIIADETFEEQLLIAENDLFEDFLDKILSSEEEKLFNENFLISQQRKNQLDEINFFRQFAKKNIQAENVVGQNVETTQSFLEKLKNLFNFKIKFAVPVLAGLLIILAIGFGWRLFYDDQPVELTSLEKQYSELNRQEFDNPALLSG